jgi:hypothetical protein
MRFFFDFERSRILSPPLHIDVAETVERRNLFIKKLFVFPL